MPATSTAPRAPVETAAGLHTATVQSRDGDTCLLLGAGGIHAARPAFGCAIQPEAGDTVLCLRDERGRYFVLNVLERQGGGPAVLGVDGDMVLRSARGDLTLAGRNLDMAAGKRLQMVGQRLDVNAAEALCQLGRSTFSGEDLTARVSRMRVFADSVETVAGRLLQRLKLCFRMVDGLDQLNARDKLETVHNLSATRARQAVLTAEQDVRIDGERVHIG